MFHSNIPYKIKVIEPIKTLNKAERLKALKKAHYNLFKIPSEKVTVDLLTDSGTSALSQEQWSGIMLGDEAYASSKSWERFEESAKRFTGKKHIIPVHQGRAAEKIIAELILQKGDFVFSNGFFDTTRANFEHRGVVCVDLPSKKSLDIEKPDKFKGDINIKKLREAIKVQPQKARSQKAVLMTLTNNTGGGQPASLKNITEASIIARKAGLIFLIDACRVAENAYFIWQHEYKKKGNIGSIIRKIFSFSDLAFMSAKKDGLANIGGFLATNNNRLASKIKELTILYEGYLTYGGISGREMETIARGLDEVVDISYLGHRIGQVAYLHAELKKLGVPLVCPSGGHAVYVDAKRFFPHVPKSNFPGQALVTALYQEGGIRSVEIGSLMYGKNTKSELVRLAIPRRAYYEAHLDHVVETFKNIIRIKKRFKGFRIIWQSPILRYFTCKLRSL